jgi:Leucine-rich repeat (LRR) protein
MNTINNRLAALLLVSMVVLEMTSSTRAKPSERISASLHEVKTTDKDVRELATKYPNLQDLYLGWPGMTDSIMPEVAKLQTLEALHIGHSQITLTANGWKPLRESPKLKELSVNDVKINEAAMKEIGQLKQVKDLYLAHNGVTDAGVKHLGDMTQLTRLGLLQKDLTDDVVPTLMKLNKLETLLVDQTQLTDAAVKQFATLPNLKSLDIRAEKISAKGVRELVACKTLRTLTVHQRQVPGEVVGLLREANPQLALHITDVGRYLTPDN